MIRITMFSGPRNISTTMMRAFENRPDTIVHDEPFYAAFLNETGAQHPMRDDILAAQPHDWAAVEAALAAPPPSGEPVSFEKHIAFHFAHAPSLDWLDKARVFHLIRDPRAMVASYANKHSDVGPIAQSYEMQRRIDDRLGGCPVVDARDVLSDPPGMLRALCAALGIEFSDAMLSWPAGARESDGVWGSHWYDAVVASTGFKAPDDKAVSLSDDLERVAEKCAEDYAYFHARRLQPAG